MVEPGDFQGPCSPAEWQEGAQPEGCSASGPMFSSLCSTGMWIGAHLGQARFPRVGNFQTLKDILDSCLSPSSQPLSPGSCTSPSCPRPGFFLQVLSPELTHVLSSHTLSGSPIQSRSYSVRSRHGGLELRENPLRVSCAIIRHPAGREFFL